MLILTADNLPWLHLDLSSL